jgi:hypothetical protein
MALVLVEDGAGVLLVVDQQFVGALLTVWFTCADTARAEST